MRVHIVGNGPSWVDYKKIDPSDFTIGCNITQAADADLTTLSDLRLVYKIRERLATINCPALVNNKVYDWLQTIKGKSAKIEIRDIYQRPEDVEPMDLSSGHYAAMWALANMDIEEIHMWGVDSIFEGHIKSHTDLLVSSHSKSDDKHMRKISERWVNEWRILEQQYPNVKFVYHAPTPQ